MNHNTRVRQGRATALYRMRRRHLTLLAKLLNDAGHTALVTEPAGMPVLTIRRADGHHLDLIATVGYGDVDWFRWMRGDYLAPCSEPRTTTTEILRALRRRSIGWPVS